MTPWRILALVALFPSISIADEAPFFQPLVTTVENLGSIPASLAACEAGMLPRFSTVVTRGWKNGASSAIEIDGNKATRARIRQGVMRGYLSRLVLNHQCQSRSSFWNLTDRKDAVETGSIDRFCSHPFGPWVFRGNARARGSMSYRGRPQPRSLPGFPSN